MEVLQNMICYQLYVCEGDSVRLEPDVAIGGVNPLGESWDGGRWITVPQHVEFITYLKKNKLYDWIGGYSWQPYVSERVREYLLPILGDAVQWIGPIECKMRRYFMLNCVNVIDCLLTGSTSNRMLIDSDAVKGHLLFRPKGRVRTLIATEELKHKICNSRDTGIRLGRIEPDGEETWFHDAEVPSQRID